MKIVSSAEMREIDRRTAERFGVPMLTLMENAGTAVAEFVLRESASSESVGVICGKGNNGGDGLVAARKLHEAGRRVQVLLLADPAEVKGDAAAMLPRVPVPVIAVRSEADLADAVAQQVFAADVLVDAVLGTGFKPPVQGLYGAAIGRMNGAGKRIVAVDVPSGLDADAMLPQAEEKQIAAAQQTVSFTAPRRGHVFSGIAGVYVTGIGSPDEAIESKLQLNVLTPGEMAALLRPRAAEANKGAFGHVLVIGGSVGKAGAAAMTGMAALRAGAGLATVATARSALPTVAGFAPEIMTEPLAETEEGTISLQALESGRMDALLERKNVVALGPGISRHADTAYFVRELLRSTAATVVLDADGLNAFEGCVEVLQGSDARPLVLTPHPGEMARLAGVSVDEVQADRLGVARRFAAEHHCIVVLKGWRTVIAEPSGEAWVNMTGNPGMAKGGSGDILTGIVAGLLAQFPRQTARATTAAVSLHGLAGDVARELVGELAMTATDLLRTLPAALARVAEAAKDRFIRIC